MTVDETLATGQYTDRRGREWRHIHGDRRWFHEPDGLWFKDGKKVIKMVHTPQMRLLIERDMHRDVCPGLQTCKEHPAPYVWIGVSGSPYHEPAWGFNDGDGHNTLSEAMDAARALAVGE